MIEIPSRCIFLVATLILTLSSVALGINKIYFHFLGNNYFPEHIFSITLILLFIVAGVNLLFPQGSKPRQMAQELLYFFAVMLIVALATNAAQLTPFTPIDAHIIALEQKVGLNMIPLMEWSAGHPWIHSTLAFIYASLEYQMSLIPLAVICSCRVHLLREYYFLLLFTTLTGFTFYYFFPTTAPASMITSPLFSAEQLATGIKFNQIHHYIQPETNNGGLIALPSFHTIWAVLCVYILREWPVLAFFLALTNLLLITSCVLLGWHYCMDIAGSFLLLLFSYYYLKICLSSFRIKS